MFQHFICKSWPSGPYIFEKLKGVDRAPPDSTTEPCGRLVLHVPLSRVFNEGRQPAKLAGYFT